MKRKKLIGYALVAGLAVMILIIGCYPNDDASAEEWDLSVSIKNPNFNNFGEITFYKLADTVSHGNAQNINKDFDATILSVVESNLQKLGWTASQSAEDADVLIFCSAVNTDVYSYWYTYWYPYWDFYYPGYYPYYPWSYGGITYDYSEGTVVIQMNYTKPDEGEKSAPAIWLGIIDGVLNDTPSNIKNRIQTGIDECFANSPYLYKK